MLISLRGIFQGNGISNSKSTLNSPEKLDIKLNSSYLMTTKNVIEVKKHTFPVGYYIFKVNNRNT